MSMYDKFFEEKLIESLLKSELSAQRWQGANYYTRSLVSVMFLTSINIEESSATKLREIDRLWREYSNDRFGFSVQKAIYQRGSYNYQQFIADVGWYKSGSWLSPSFKETAPKGHLPYCGDSFWKPPSSMMHLGSSHQSHLPHAHPHPPHRHSQDGDAAGAAAGAGLLGLLSPAAPFILGAAAAAGVGYLIYHVATKDERERKERLEQEESDRRRAQRQLEENQKIQKNIETLLSLI